MAPTIVNLDQSRKATYRLYQSTRSPRYISPYNSQNHSVIATSLLVDFGFLSEYDVLHYSMMKYIYWVIDFTAKDFDGIIGGRSPRLLRGFSHFLQGDQVDLAVAACFFSQRTFI
jgi:hypothetical protein